MEQTFCELFGSPKVCKTAFTVSGFPREVFSTESTPWKSALMAASPQVNRITVNVSPRCVDTTTSSSLGEGIGPSCTHPLFFFAFFRFFRTQLTPLDQEQVKKMFIAASKLRCTQLQQLSKGICSQKHESEASQSGTLPSLPDFSQHSQVVRNLFGRVFGQNGNFGKVVPLRFCLKQGNERR